MTAITMSISVMIPSKAVAVTMALLLLPEDKPTLGVTLGLMDEDMEDMDIGVDDGRVMVGVPIQLTPATVG